MALNKPDKPSKEWKEKDNTFFNVHPISTSVTESDITYKSSVDILLELLVSELVEKEEEAEI